MNKKILMSLVVIGIVAGVTLGITGAYFSDTATSTSNSFHSGTLDLKLGPNSSTYSDSVTGTFMADDMVPGGAGVTGTVWLENTGKVEADHVRIISVVNTPSDNRINEPECKAYDGEWKWYGNLGTVCVLSRAMANDENRCVNELGGKWINFSEYGQYRCYAKHDEGFKDGVGGWNDIDKHLQITSIKYAGTEKVGAYDRSAQCAGYYYDWNRNGYYDLDDLEQGAWTKDGCVLDNLKPVDNPHSFQMTVKLHEDAGNVYQTDKDGIEITFQLNQNASQ